MRERSSTVQREMAATPAEIWAYRLDFRNLPAYNPDVRNLELVSEGDGDGVGAAYGFDLVGPRGAFPIELEVTRTEPDRVVAIEMRGVLPAAEVFTVEPLETDGDDPRSSVSIALTLRIPDEFPANGDDDLLASGVRQMGDELDAMAASLAVRSSR
jgi:Polyketide cyclase / dehydrase and lipid transport